MSHELNLNNFLYFKKANARHLNICASSVYVNQDGTWKLAGFEHLWKTKDVTIALLQRTAPYRYKKAIDPHELKAMSTNGIEQYAFAVLCMDVLKNSKTTTMLPHINEFKTYCSTHLKHTNITLRPKLSAILLHPFFNHEFVLIHSFLTELPLKNPQEKQQFFTNLIERLRQFDEEIVAKQLIGFLLSRMVLLDTTAHLCVTPFVLRPRTDDNFAALFGATIFTKYIVPRLMNIFYVRDAQIRLILLEYFKHYIRYVAADDLQEQLLPQLLVGIKDTNDVLVAATLRCLADLVPILGSAVVIGRNRGRIFADGRPTNGLQTDVIQPTVNWTEHRSITPVMNTAAAAAAGISNCLTAGATTGDGSPLLDHVDISESYASPQNSMMMPERPSPDGGEDVTSSGVLEFEDDGWSDWEAENNLVVDHEITMKINSNDIDAVTASLHTINNDNIEQNYASTTTTTTAGNFIKDIKEMDIKTKRKKSADVEFDFFKDMEPVIQKTNVLLIDAIGSTTSSSAPVVLPTIQQPTTISDDAIVADNVDNVTDDKLIETNTSQLIDKSRFEMKATDGGDAADEIGWDDETNGWDEND